MTTKNKLDNGQFMIDEEKNVLTFLDSRFYKSNHTGMYYPSSTTVLDAFPKGPEFYKWLKENGMEADNIRDEAGARGSKVHKFTEDYDNGLEVSLFKGDGTIGCDTRVWKMFERYVEFSTKYNPNILYNELSLCSDELGYGGTIDRIIELDGKKVLMDIKTSNNLQESYFLQLASYVHLFQEQIKPDFKIDGICILWLNSKTRTEGKAGTYQGKGYQLVFPEQSIDYYFNLFQHTKVLWDVQNKDYKPLNLSYKMSHKKG